MSYSIPWDDFAQAYYGKLSASKGRPAMNKYFSTLLSFLMVNILVVTAIPASAIDADSDFQERCNAPGVIVCEGFDDASDFICSADDQGLEPIFGTTECQGHQDTIIKASGNSSLRLIYQGQSKIKHQLAYIITLL